MNVLLVGHFSGSDVTLRATLIPRNSKSQTKGINTTGKGTVLSSGAIDAVAGARPTNQGV